MTIVVGEANAHIDFLSIQDEKDKDLKMNVPVRPSPMSNFDTVNYFIKDTGMTIWEIA